MPGRGRGDARRVYGLNKAGVARLWPTCLLGVVLWVFVLASGVHATIAGVLLALTIPLRLSAGKPDDPSSPLHILEHAVHPWSAYLILPIFAFANAGVSLAGITPGMLLDPVTLGVALGLFVGKQVGVFGLVLAAVKLGLAQRPAHAGWWQVYGVALLCGLGFTMSLFIGLLAFAIAPELEAETKIGVLIGSLACMAAGALVLRSPRPARPIAEPKPAAPRRAWAVVSEIRGTGVSIMARRFPRRHPAPWMAVCRTSCSPSPGSCSSGWGFCCCCHGCRAMPRAPWRRPR